MTLFAAIFAIMLIPAAPSAGDERRGEWISFDPDRPEGSPIQVVVSQSSAEITELQISIPGVWLSAASYAGETFSKVEFPDLRLAGAGFPQRQGERGWFDFPEKSGYPLLNPERYRNALSSSVPRYFFPEEAMEDPPETAEEMERMGVNPAGARPGIPALRGLLAVTEDTNPERDLLQVVAIQKERQIKLPHPLIPAGFEGFDQEKPEGYTPPELIDKKFYAEFEGRYGGVEDSFSTISRAGLFSRAEFRVPLMTLSEVKTVTIPEMLVVTLGHLPGPLDFDCPLPWDHWIFKAPFVNGAALRNLLTARGQAILASRSARYLILTPKKYHADLMPFAFWKNSKGLAIDFAFVGQDVPPDRDAIDAYLEKYFREHYCHGVYVLLVGDRDTIPSGRSDFLVSNPDASLGDSDHVYEVLGGDRFPSLYVGRLAVASADELEVQLAKILQYEKFPPFGNWPLQVTLAANSENDNGTAGVSAAFPSKYAQAVNEIAGYASYAPSPNFEVLHAGASSASAPRATNDDVIDAINKGRGQVLYRGHGSPTTWLGGWDGSSQWGDWFRAGTHLPMLENRVHPIVYSIACQNSRMRSNGYIANEWMNRETGAVAHWGATINSATGENHERAKGIFRALYESGFNRLGPMLGEAERISHTATGGGETWDNNTFAYLLHGCPELTIRRSPVLGNFIRVAHDFDTSGIYLLIFDEKTEREIPAALVNIELKGGLGLNGFTGSDGRLFIELDEEQRKSILSIQVHAGEYQFGEKELQPAQPTEIWVESIHPLNGARIAIRGRFDGYLVQYSDDLQTWHTLGEVVAEGGYAEIVDPAAARQAKRFYRAVPLL